MLDEQIHFEINDTYKTGKTHVEYLAYLQNDLATLTLESFTAKLILSGECSLVYKEKDRVGQINSSCLNHDIIKAIRDKSPDIEYISENKFAIEIYCDEVMVDVLPSNLFELPTPLETKDLLLQAMKRIPEKFSVHLTKEEKALLEGI